MLPRFLVSIASCVLFVINAHAVTFTVKPDSGVILVWQQQKSASWIAVKDSVAMGAADSLYLNDQYHAKLFLGKGCALYLRGELRANLAGSDSALTIHLDQGQVFLKREPGAELANIKIVLRGCAFTPVGAAASIKCTKQGEPTVAVLAGSVRVTPPKGEPLVVTPGNFGTYDPAGGVFKQGKLPAEAIASLENWSGTKLDLSTAAAAPDAAKPAVKDTTQKAAQPAASMQQPPATQAQPAQTVK
jgi:hypothetical protein